MVGITKGTRSDVFGYMFASWVRAIGEVCFIPWLFFYLPKPFPQDMHPSFFVNKRTLVEESQFVKGEGCGGLRA